MRVKCLAQEHNTMIRSGLEPEPFDPESNALTIRPPGHPLLRALNPIPYKVVFETKLTIKCRRRYTKK